MSKRNSILRNSIIASLAVISFIISVTFYKGKWIGNENHYFEIYFVFLVQRFFITTGVAGCIIVSTILLQKFIKNPIAEPSLLGISQVNFITYTLIFLISKPFFINIFMTKNISSTILQFIIYFTFSTFIVFFIIWFTKNLKTKYIVIIGIIFNILFSVATIILLKKFNFEDGDFYVIYSKMVGNFVPAEFADKFWIINVPKFLAIVSNLTTIIGISLIKFFNYRIAKNELLVGRFGITNNRRFITRLLLVVGISFYSVIAFMMVGILSFFAIGIILLAKIIFGYSSEKHIFAIYFIAIILLTNIDFTIENFIFPNLNIEVPKGLFASMVAIPILLFSLIKKEVTND